MQFLIEIEQNEFGWVAECPALPACVSQGESQAEAVENIKDAIHTYFETVTAVKGNRVKLVAVDVAIPNLSAA